MDEFTRQLYQKHEIAPRIGIGKRRCDCPEHRAWTLGKPESRRYARRLLRQGDKQRTDMG